VTDVHPVAAAGFGAGAEVYERARPSYPVEAVEWLAERTGLGPGRTIVDVGAGTGKLTRLLPATGARVIAVEPVPEMRAKLLEVIPGVEALEGTAERLPLADSEADVVVVAQAFHWFDHERALPEIHRVLRPNGYLTLVWNMRDLENSVQAGVDALLRSVRQRVDSYPAGSWREALEQSPLFGPRDERAFRFEQWFTTADLAERVASTSFVATMNAPERDELLAQVRAVADGLPEPFPFPYRTEVQVIPRSSDRGGNERGTSIKG
jgi:ubiquinone/menaquinone biosynthesis C-methylase UbiE